MIPAPFDSPSKQKQLQAETPRRNQKLAAFAFSIRFTSTRSPTGKDGSLERSLGEDKAIDVQHEHLQRYLSFSPKAVHRSLFERQGSTPEWHPVAEQVFAAVLFADISGFTRLSARLGADHLKAHINSYFGSMIRVIDKYCGDVIKFCGDAVMIVWQTSLGDSDEAKQAAALLAAACSLSLLDECGSYDHGSGNQAVSLRLHCGIGVGNMHTYIVGNTARAEYLISGDPLRQIAATESEAAVGEVVISPEAFALLKEEFLVENTPNANYKLLEQDSSRSRQSSGSSKGPLRQSLSLLTGGRRTPKGVVPSPDGSPTYSPRTDKIKRPRLSMFSNFSVPPPTPDDATAHSDNASDNSDYASTLAEKVMSNFHKGLISDRPRKKLPEDAIRHLPHLSNEVISPRQSRSVPISTIQNVAAFVQEPARAAIQTGAMSYLAEIREVVTIFINIRGLEQPLEQGDVQSIQKVMEVTLEALGKYRGALRQFVVDDKGCVMILAFGLPRFTHEDNATRAVEASVLVRDSLTYFHLTCKIGITHGQVYCGLVGSEGRHEYAMMGASVNLAARLMASCADGEIRVSDDIVQRTAKSGFVFHSLGKIKAKGYSRPVAVFKPCEKRKGMELKMMDDQHPLYGRRNELGLLQHACDTLSEQPKERTFLVRGPAGIGKTRLLSEVARYAQQQHMTVVAAAGVPSQKAQNYFVVTQLLEIITGVEKEAGDLSSRSPDAPGGYRVLLADWIRNHISVSEVGDYPLQDILSLLNDVVDAGFPDHETVLGLRVDERQRLQAELLCAILRNSLESQPSVLIVDDLQWVDAQSCLILSMLFEQGADLLCCLATRAQHGIECGLSSLEGVTEVVLSPLDIDECAALVSTIVGERVKAQFSHEISESTLCAIHARAGGVPAYIKELSSALKEALFTSTFRSVQELTLRAQDVTMQQFDQLRGAEQILLKAASVIGLEFSTDVLQYALSNVGAEREATHMHKILDHLLGAGLVRCLTEGDTPDKVYMFAHFSLKETAYNLMLEEHRQRLHEAIASFFELQGPLDPVCLQMCVHHYLKTDNTEKKQQYLAASAAFAREQHCYADLLNSCSQLLNIACGVDEQQIVHALVQGRRLSVEPSAAQFGVFRPRKRRVLHMFSFSDMFPAGRISPADRPNVLQQGIIPAWVSAKDVTVCQLSEELSNEWIGLWLAQVGLAMFNLGKVRDGHSRMVVGLKLMGFSVSTSITRTGYWWRRHVAQRCLPRVQDTHTAKHTATALECYQLLCATELFRARLLEAIVNLDAAYTAFGQLTFPPDNCALCRLHALSALCLQAQGQHEHAASERELARRCENSNDEGRMSHMHVDIIDGVWHLNRGDWAAANAATTAALARLDPQQQGSSGSVAMLVMSWAKLFEGDLQGTASLLDELERSFNFAQRGIITRWTLQTMLVYHSLHGDQRTAELAAEKLKQSTGHRKSNAVRAALVALTHRRSGNHEGSYKYAKYAVQRFATRGQISFIGHFLFFCVIDAIYHAILRHDAQHATTAPILRASGGVEEMRKYLTMGTHAFCRMSRSFPAASNLSKIASARLLYLAGQRPDAASELEKCVSDECTFQSATALLDLIRVRKSLSDTGITELKDRATHLIERLNLAFEARQLQTLVS